MKKRLFLHSILFFFVCSAGGSASGLISQDKKLYVPFNFSGFTPAKWQNGFLVATEVETGTVVVHGRDGNLKVRAKVSLPKARTVLYSASMSREGKLIASGTSFSEDGKVAPFIAFISDKGNIEQLVRPENFGAIAVCFAPDGSFWALGRSVASTFQEIPGHAILRRYSPKGELLQAALSIDSFPNHRKDKDPHPATMSHLAATPSGVALYSGIADEYIEVSESTGEVRRWPGVQRRAEKVLVTGVAVTSSGVTYLSTQESNRAQGDADTVVYRLNKQTGAWSRVDQASADAKVYLQGADGEELVVRDSQAGALVWVREGR
jgi:hypothetical protein